MDFLPGGQPSPRIVCRYRKCKASFSRKTDARRHERQVHQSAKIFCKFAGCRFRGTVRAEVMRRHLKSKHLFEGKSSEQDCAISQDLPADPAQVESTFQLDNDNLEGGLPKVKIPREFPFPEHKIDSFSNWSSRLLPIVSNPHETHEVEQLLETYTGIGDELLSGNSIPLSGVEEIDVEPTNFEHGTDNQQTVDQYHIGEIQATEIIASSSHYAPCQNRYPGSDEQHPGWQN